MRYYDGLKLIAFAKTKGRCHHCSDLLILSGKYIGPLKSGKRFYYKSDVGRLFRENLERKLFPRKKVKDDSTVYLKAEIDHIIPKADGGATHDLKNLQALCEECHKEKTSKENSKRMIQIHSRKRRERRLYNLRSTICRISCFNERKKLQVSLDDFF